MCRRERYVRGPSASRLRRSQQKVGGCRLNRLMVELTSCRRVSRYRLKDDQFLCRNLRGLLERGVQKVMDPTEPKGPIDLSAPPLAIETMLGYTGAVGTALWYELSRDRGKVGRKRPRDISFSLTFSSVGLFNGQGDKRRKPVSKALEDRCRPPGG